MITSKKHNKTSFIKKEETIIIYHSTYSYNSSFYSFDAPAYQSINQPVISWYQAHTHYPIDKSSSLHLWCQITCTNHITFGVRCLEGYLYCLCQCIWNPQKMNDFVWYQTIDRNCWLIMSRFLNPDNGYYVCSSSVLLFLFRLNNKFNNIWTYNIKYLFCE